MMKKTILAALALSLVAAPAFAATVVNNDSEVRTLIVTEGSSKSELAVGAGESVDFCPSGCFVTMPNGDREALTGSETIEIKGGQARIR
jgi:opacity protein-like surface antigen